MACWTAVCGITVHIREGVPVEAGECGVVVGRWVAAVVGMCVAEVVHVCNAWLCAFL